MKTLLPAAYSPCPNDSYIFLAWEKGWIESSLRLVPTLLDIQSLNQSLANQLYPLCKTSVFAALTTPAPYTLLPIGGALGYSCGPLLVGKPDFKTVAIPGQDTVAHLLYRMFSDQGARVLFTSYDKILSMVAQNQVDAGVLIHESRFTYQNYGLEKLADYGMLWEEKTAAPLPLGCLLASDTLHPDFVMDAVQKSIAYADAHFEEMMPLIMERAQEKDPENLRRFIDLYITEDTRALTEKGSAAIHIMQEMIQKLGLGTSSSHILTHV